MLKSISYSLVEGNRTLGRLFHKMCELYLFSLSMAHNLSPRDTQLSKEPLSSCKSHWHNTLVTLNTFKMLPIYTKLLQFFKGKMWCSISRWGGQGANLTVSHRVINSRPSARIHLDSPSGILQASMDSRHVTLYDELKYLQESI